MRDGRGFLLGRAPSAADLSAYHTIRFARRNGGREAVVMHRNDRVGVVHVHFPRAGFDVQPA